MLEGKQLERFLSKIKKVESGCWEWQGKPNLNGYSQFKYKGKYPGVHRVSYMHFNNVEINPKILVCHSCDNKRCVNPEHLFLGSYSENRNDMIAKGRARTKEFYNRMVD